MLTSPLTFFRRIREDKKNFVWQNTGEEQVLAAHYFSAYRGKLVLRTDLRRSGSVGILFLSRREKSVLSVRHEYGHTKQLARLGFFRYLLYVFLPSSRNWGEESYYRRPWEITADLLGGVDPLARTGDEPLREAHIQNGERHMAIAESRMAPWKKYAAIRAPRKKD